MLVLKVKVVPKVNLVPMVHKVQLVHKEKKVKEVPVETQDQLGHQAQLEKGVHQVIEVSRDQMVYLGLRELKGNVELQEPQDLKGLLGILVVLESQDFLVPEV